MEMRVARLMGGQVYAQTPPSRTRRLVTNIRLLEANAELARVASNLSITEVRRGKKSIYTGRSEYDLVSVGPDWKIRRKKVELVENNEALGNLSFIL